MLGLLALKFGAGEAVGVEIDPDSIAAAHSNAAINSLPVPPGFGVQVGVWELRIYG